MEVVQNEDFSEDIVTEPIGSEDAILKEDIKKCKKDEDIDVKEHSGNFADRRADKERGCYGYGCCFTRGPWTKSSVFIDACRRRKIKRDKDF